MVDGFRDGYFKVEKDSSFSRALAKELRLDDAQVKQIGLSVWNQIFAVAEKENMGDINNVNAGKEFTFSKEGWNEILGYVNSSLGTDLKPEEKKESSTPVDVRNRAGNTPGVRNKDEMDNTDKLYKEANDIIGKLNNREKAYGLKFDISVILEDVTKENLPYVLAEKPDFFDKVKAGLSPKDLKKALNDLATKMGVEVKGLDSDAIIEKLKEYAVNNPANPKVTKEDRENWDKAKKENDDFQKRREERLKKEAEEQNAYYQRKANISHAERTLEVTVPKTGAMQASIDRNNANAQTNLVFMKSWINDTPGAKPRFEEMSPKELAYIFANIPEETDANREYPKRNIPLNTDTVGKNLTQNDLLALVKKLDPKFEGDVATISDLVERAKTIVKNDKSAAEKEVENLKIQKENFDASIKQLAEIRYADPKPEVVKLKSGYVINTPDGNAIRVLTDKDNNITSIKVTKVTVESGKYHFEEPKVEFRRDKAFSNTQLNNGVFEYFQTEGYDFNKICALVKGLLPA